MLQISSEELSDIKEQLAIIRTTGENTLAECRKTNGRVTKLEDSHNELKTNLAVLKTSVEKDFKIVDRDLSDLTPKVEDSKSFMDVLRGNWQSLAIIGMIIAWWIDKFVK